MIEFIAMVINGILLRMVMIFLIVPILIVMTLIDVEMGFKYALGVGLRYFKIQAENDEEE